MKRLEITNGRARLYFDPATSFLRMDYNGAGPTMGLKRADKVKFVAALIVSLEAEDGAP